MNVAFSEQDYSDNGNGTASASYDAQGNPYMRSAVTRGVNTRDALGRVTSY
jgi:hypothetical protein